MSIYEELLEIALKRCEGRFVSDVRIGLGYLASKLSDGRCGLAYVFRNKLSHTCSVLKRAGDLDGSPAEFMARLFLSDDMLEASLGLSVINALSPEPESALTGDLLDHIDIEPDSTVSMVGFFGPLIPELKKRTGSFYVFDQLAEKAPFVLSPERMPDVLPSSDIVIITATSLINKSFEGIVELSKNAKEVCLLGPSTPLYPDVLKGWGVTVAAGVRVTDPDRILKVVSQGGGTRNFKGAVRKVVIRIS